MNEKSHRLNSSRILLRCLITILTIISLQGTTGNNHVAYGATDASCQLTWTLRAAPSTYITAIAAVASDDVWMANDSILHWNGTEWDLVQPMENRAIVDFAVLSTNDIWGVGWRFENNYEHSLVFHWDGQSWKDVAISDIGNLSGVAALATNSIWVVGNANGVTPTSLHWNGTEWESMTMPYSDWRVHRASVTNLSALNANDIWAVGRFEGQSSALSNVMIWHWDGNQWNYMPENLGWFASFNAVQAISSNDVWAVGQTTNNDTLLAHWNGFQWNAVNDNHLGTLIDISGTSADNVWAVGGYETNNSNQLLMEHWDGQAWKVINLPQTEGYLNGLARVAAITDNDVWAVGSEIFHGGPPCVSAKPIKPKLISPNDQQEVTNSRVKLRWQVATNTGWYQVTVKRGTKIVDQQFYLTESRYLTRKLKRGDTYIWRVKACNSLGCRGSPWWTFTIAE